MTTYLRELPEVDSLPPSFSDRLERVLEEFASQIIAPPDKYIRNCYKATLNVLTKNKRLKRIFSKVLTNRSLTPQYFVNLYFRSLQHIELTKKKNPRYPEKLTNIDRWGREIESIVDEYSKEISDIMLFKNTQTTIFQRYAGPKFIITSFFGNSKVNIADMGCGGNYGLPGLSVGEPFKILQDLTPNHEFTKGIGFKINIESGLAIDQEDPNAPGAREWLHSCSFYPSELNDLPKVLEFEKRISKVKNIHFLKKDISGLTPSFLNGHVEPNSFDAVIFSTVLYQDPSSQTQALENARSLLKPNGIAIIQDFAIVKKDDDTQLDFDRDWHVPGNYRTFVTGPKLDWKFKEILKWDKARCKIVKAGSNFSLIERR